MKKVFFILILISSTLWAEKIALKDLWANTGKQTTATKIETKKSDLKRTDVSQRQINKKIGKIVKKIRKAEKENRRLTKVLKSLSIDKKMNEDKRVKTNKQVNSIKKQMSTLDKVIERQRSGFQNLLINQFSMIVAMDKMEKTTINTIVMKEIYNVYKVKNVKGLNELKAKISINQKKRLKALKMAKDLEKSISSITKKRELYLKKKKQKKRLLKQLSIDEANYRKSISNLAKKQDFLQSTLAKLNIIRKDEIREARKQEIARQKEMKRIAAQREREREQDVEHVKAKSFATKQGVKQYGSSYHKDRTFSYRGAKTISPLKSSRVTKAFGTYTDPIYKMKIYNESITLKSSKKNAKVRNVLNGKVVFAGENSMLGKVVIIAHNNQLHTVYAGLSKISSIVKTGSKIKKGKVIGRIKSKLIFEATKNSKYINPMRLISL